MAPSKLQSSRPSLYILGDFNCTEIDWQVGATCHPHNQSTVEFVQTIEDCFYTQHVLSPTRSSSILDIVLSRDPELVSNVNVLHSLDNSDHNIISFTVHSRSDYGIISKTVRDFKRGKFDQINNVLSSIDWDKVRNSRRNFEKKLADNIKEDNKSFFAYAHSKTKSKVKVGPLIGSNGILIESVEDTADMLNNYSASVFTLKDTSSIPEPISMNSEAYIYDLQFTESDVLRVLSRL